MRKEGTLLARFKKRCMVTMLAAAMLLGAAGNASAIDFKASGEWLVGFGVGDGNLFSRSIDGNGEKSKNRDDKFGASQRVKLQLDAVASEYLSGTVFFEIGDQNWGNAGEGAALGADGKVVEVKNAYIDWAVPDTALKLRMGLQGIALPNVAGGSSVLDGDGAAVVASYQFNDNVGLTAFWMRPVNDNFNTEETTTSPNSRSFHTNWLDNMDLFALTLPLTFDGIEATPWVMYGIQGKNALRDLDETWETQDGALLATVPGGYPGLAYTNGRPGGEPSTKKVWGSMFWAGLPVALSLWDPINIEFDINYGYVEKMGRYDVDVRGGLDRKRASTQREGWIAKALIEYKMDWGVPGIFGWYGSGDDGNVKNGSERMPSIAGAANFTPFIGDGNLAWSPIANGCDWSMSYAGSWGIGVQVRDMSFVEDLSHTFIASYRGGTNSPSMVKYMDNATSWWDGIGGDGPYLTTNDGLMEFNLINNYKMYENFDVNLELGYVINMMDNDTWKRSWFGSYKKQDAYKAQLVFAYSF
ncbi:MAG: outer membrane homotrimeric porin [Desulfovibrio sp.]|nr:outer membrane homotrimeric porin [Desulfovibrio sp.]